MKSPEIMHIVWKRVCLLTHMEGEETFPPEAQDHNRQVRLQMSHAWCKIMAAGDCVVLTRRGQEIHCFAVTNKKGDAS